MLTLWGYVIMGMGATGGIGLSIAFRKIGQFFSPGPRHEAFFSPNGGITTALTRHISKARREILLQGFSFNSRTISDALCAAKKRGVHVEILLDQITEKDPSSDLSFLIDSGFDVQIDANHGCAHNKILLIDNRTLINGSFNFTRQAEEENAENILVVQGVPDLIHTYREQFLIHKAHARPAQKPGLLRQGTPLAQPMAAQVPISRAPIPQTQATPASQPTRLQPTPPVQVPQPVAQSIPISQPSRPVAPSPAAVSNLTTPPNSPIATPSVAASLANMGLGNSSQPTTQTPTLHPGHNQQAGPHLGNPLSGVSNLGGTQMTPEMLRAMVQNAANARNG